MSSQLLGAAWKHLPWSGGMLVLALKLVDNAHDDGRHIFPSIDELAARTKQSDRTVQRQLRAMEASGWLVCEIRSNGGRNRSSRYRIAPQWVSDPGAFVFASGDAADAAPAAQSVPAADDPAAFLPHEIDALAQSPAAETVTLAAEKPRQNVTVAREVPPPQTVTSETETVTPVSGAYNPQEPLLPPVSPFIDAEQVGGQVGGRVNGGKAAAEPDDLRLAEWMFALVRALNPEHRQPAWARWTKAIRLMRERDKRSRRDIAALFRWANADPFWHSNILSPDTLRSKWDRLVIERQRKSAPPVLPSAAPVLTAQPDRGCRWLTAGGLRCTCRGTRSDGAHTDAPWYCREHWDALERQRAGVA